ncbi:OmpA family protein [Pseudonocardia lacus]|uniref:OmpA family protein n=1 Tax=Pseudonocardia lacus TaxID=2835865 RepID=UPI001BDC0E1B|nr:OmpA family protein [Pseudonocardia lacus]
MRSRLIPLVLALFSLLGLLATACGMPAGPSSPPSVEAVGQAAPEQCDVLERVPPPVDPSPVVLLVDRTASMMDTDPPPAVQEQLAAAQQAGEGLVIVAVDGDGRVPRTVARIALDPEPGKESPNARNARRLVLACIGWWTTRADPTGEGTALLEALDAAARMRPAMLLVWSDGVSTKGVFDLGVLGYDVEPDAVVAAARAEGQLPPLRDVPIVWVGLGDTTTGLPRAERGDLQAVLTALVTASGAASVEFDPRPGAAPTDVGAPGVRPADSVPAPNSGPIDVPGGGSCYRLADAVLFAPGSDVPGPGATAAVSDAVTELRAHPGWVVDVQGHAADYESEQERQRISTARAEAIADIIRAAAAPIEPERVRAAGFGSTRPLVDEWRGDAHDEAAAAQNRRVEVVVHPAGTPAECGG